MNMRLGDSDRVKLQEGGRVRLPEVLCCEVGVEVESSKLRLRLRLLTPFKCCDLTSSVVHEVFFIDCKERRLSNGSQDTWYSS